MSDMRIPIVNDDGYTEVIQVDRDSLSLEDREIADMFLDAADYELRGMTPGPKGGGGTHVLADFEGATVGNWHLQTSLDALEDLVSDDEFNPNEDHSL